jgi:hypothetical protein
MERFLVITGTPTYLEMFANVKQLQELLINAQPDPKIVPGRQVKRRMSSTGGLSLTGGRFLTRSYVTRGLIRLSDVEPLFPSADLFADLFNVCCPFNGCEIVRRG